MIRLTLPEAPSANRYWRHVGAKVLRSREAINYIGAVRLVCSARKVRPIGGEVTLEVSWYRGRRSGDLDNRVKILQDALKGHAFGDDASVRRLVAERFEDKARPRMEVTISEYQAVPTTEKDTK